MPLLPPEERYRLCQWLSVSWLIAIAVSLGLVAREERAFHSMSPKEHLHRARDASWDSVRSIDASLRHLAAIPDGSLIGPAARQLGTELRAEEAAIQASSGGRDEAEVGQAMALSLLASDLKDLGYDVVVERDGALNEITIASAEFSEARNRSRFLGSLRGVGAPTYSVCWQGFRTVRLRASRIPHVGFNAVYGLDCDGVLDESRVGGVLARP